MYSYEDRIRAVESCVSSGFSPKAVSNALGFPSKNSVKTWYREYLEELHGGDRHDRHRRRETYTPEQKRAAVESYIENGKGRARTVRELGYPGTDTRAETVAASIGVTRAALYKWSDSLLGKGAAGRMDRTRDDAGLPEGKDALEAEMASLKEQIRRLKAERDILDGTVETVRKTRAPIRRT